jgi:hypothetical protein
MDYINTGSGTSSAQDVPKGHPAKRNSQTIFTTVQNQVSAKPSVASSRSEFDLYIEEERLPDDENFDILGWWKGNGLKYPVMQKIARDFLAIPISTVASESSFSTSGRILTPHRSKLR